MRLRQTWLAVSLSKSTVMFTTVPSNIVVPPLGDARPAEVNLALAAGQRANVSDFWLAISQEEGMT